MIIPTASDRVRPRWDRCRQLLQSDPSSSAALAAQRGRSGATALVQALRQAGKRGENQGRTMGKRVKSREI